VQQAGSDFDRQQIEQNQHLTDRGCLYWRWDVVQLLVLALRRPFGNHEWIAQGYILLRDSFVVANPSFGCSLVVDWLGYRER